MKLRRVLFLMVAAVAVCSNLQAQSSELSIIKVDYNVQRYIGDVSALQRDKYFTIHGSGFNDPDLKTFREEYDVAYGRGFWGPLSYVSSLKVNGQQAYKEGKYPKAVKTTKPREWVNTFVATEHPQPHHITYNSDLKKKAKWVADYYAKVAPGVIPMFFEPFNEPFVHSNDLGNDKKNKFGAPTGQDMKVRFAEYFAEVGKAIDAAPELKQMKVVGYADAWPQMEMHDFAHWRNNMQMFMDKAGEYMDAFSIHLYDGFNVKGGKNRRSGANSEAILDLVETYSYIKWGVAKPFAITEYGGIEDTYGIDFVESTAYKVLPSVNHIMMNLLEREDNLLISIPFIGEKNEWYIKSNNGKSYTSSLFLPTNPKDLSKTEWKINRKEDLFKLWKSVSGERVIIESSNPDIQASAFKNGDTLYIAVDNLDTTPQRVKLEDVVAGWEALDVTRRSFSVSGATGEVDYSETKCDLKQEIKLQVDETSVFVVKLKDPKFDNVIRRQRYHSLTYLQKVEAGKAIDFKFNAVKTGDGIAKVRVSYATPIGAEGYVHVVPEMFVNGKTVAFPTNWGGGNNKNGNDFFGTFEVSFDLGLLKSGENTITLKYPNNKGRVSTVILDVERYDNTPKRNI